MRAMRGGAPLVAAALAACSVRPDNVGTPFPLEVGYQMLEPVSAQATLPETMGPDSAKGPYASGADAGHFVWAHARGYVHANVDAVWTVLHDPCVSRIYTELGATSAAQLEPLENVGHFPLFFGIRVTEIRYGITAQWVHEYRGGPVPAAGPPQGYGMRYQKVIGIENVRVQSGSLEIRPAASDPANWTEIAMEHWLDVKGGVGEQPGIPEAQGAINDWFMNILWRLGVPFEGQPVPAPWNYCPAPTLPIQP
jgi:hypothetical protein